VGAGIRPLGWRRAEPRMGGGVAAHLLLLFVR